MHITIWREEGRTGQDEKSKDVIIQDKEFRDLYDRMSKIHGAAAQAV